jgi:Rrf2 family protein
MLRNKTATYALLAIYEIARQHRGVSEPLGIRAHDIANKHKLPKAYVAKILSQLANSGILHSDRGPRGGFRLNQVPEKISLYDIFTGVGAIIGNEAQRGAVKGLPPRVQSTMNRARQDITDRLKEMFQKVTLAEVLGEENGG